MELSLIPQAVAQTAAATPPAPSMVELFMLPLGFLAIMYFFIIRPQQKKAKEHVNLLANLKSGDEVFTSGGIIGRVRAVAEGFVTLEIASNTPIKVLKSNITGLTKEAAATPAAKKKS